MRKLSLAGKISVVKFLVIPKFVYLFSNISNPPKKFFDELQSKLFRFIWSNKKDRIKGVTRKTGLKEDLVFFIMS